MHWDPEPPNTIVPCRFYRTVSFDFTVGQLLAPSLFQARRMPALEANMSPVTGAQRRVGGMGTCSPSAADPAPAALQPRTLPERFHHPRCPAKESAFHPLKWCLEDTRRKGIPFALPPVRLVTWLTTVTLESHNLLLSGHLSSHSPSVAWLGPHLPSGRSERGSLWWQSSHWAAGFALTSVRHPGCSCRLCRCIFWLGQNSWLQKPSACEEDEL